jgi:beta-lactamase class A
MQPTMIDRRHFNLALTLGLSMGAPRAHAAPEAVEALQALEAASGGRLGVHIQDTGSQSPGASHRADERFLMCSTVKLLVAAHVLHRADRGEEALNRRVRYTAADLLGHSPVAEKNLAGGLTVAQLCQATMTQSDNAACNLLLRRSGGPEAVTAYLRGLGDEVTLLSDYEMELNRLKPGRPDNTTTPRAMAATLRRLALGDALKPASRALLVGWLRGNLTGDHRLRAGLGRRYTVGDKTGTGDGTSNDVAVVWPSHGRAPWLVTSFLTESPAPSAARDASLAQVGRLAAQLIG